jgi:membrane protein implicated in regulation of membrane protease activity
MSERSGAGQVFAILGGILLLAGIVTVGFSLPLGVLMIAVGSVVLVYLQRKNADEGENLLKQKYLPDVSSRFGNPWMRRII